MSSDTEHISHVEEPSKQRRRGVKRPHSVAKLEEENSTTPKQRMVAKPETPTKQPQEKGEPGSTSSGETRSWTPLDFPESISHVIARPETPTEHLPEREEAGTSSSSAGAGIRTSLEITSEGAGPSAPQPDRQVSKDAVLCLDGGGIRGFVLIYLLKEIEKTSGKKITDLFDWIVGTSTGGIIAMALAKGILHKHVRWDLIIVLSLKCFKFHTQK